VWGFDYAGDERTVDVHIARLRAAFEDPWKLRGALLTVHGYGYKFVRG
jgi:DNA-binding response OmpR family regulator